jgi:branched-chain amino acid transport system substrate-binding protein
MNHNPLAKLGAAAFLVLSVIVSFGGCEKRSALDNAPVHVGVILPLTGDAAVYGQAIKDGIELARSEKAQASDPRIELTYEDDQGQPPRAVTAAQRLLQMQDVVAVIGGAMSSTAEAIVPIFNERKRVLISPTATKPSLTKEGGYFFRLWPSDDYDGKFMAEAAFTKLNIKSVGVIYINAAYGKGITDVFTAEYTKLGGKIVLSEGYEPGTTDFRALLEKVKEKNPEAVFLPGYVAEISRFLMQAKEATLSCRILGVNSLHDKKLIEIAGTAAEDAVFSYPEFDSDSAKPEINDFVATYKARYQKPPDAFAAQGYDSYRVIAEALRKAPAPVVDSLRSTMLSLPTSVGPGGPVKFLPNGDVEKPLRLLMIKRGEFVEFP